MRQFSFAAQMYIWGVIAVGGLSLLGSLLFGPGSDKLLHPDHLLPICLCVALGVFPGSVKLSLLARTRRGVASENNATMSLGFIPTFFTLFMFGPAAGMLVATANVITTTLHPRRSYYYQVLFSVGAIIVANLVAGFVLRPFGLAPGGWDADIVKQENAHRLLLPLLGIALATGVYYLTNTILVMIALHLASGQKIINLWRSMGWTSLGYFVGASIAALLMVFMPIIGKNPWASLALLLALLPFPALVFLMYKYHVQWEVVNAQRVAELTHSQERLQEHFDQTIRMLARVIDAKDRYTKEHIQRVTVFAVMIANALDLKGEDLKNLETGALLHDIGKLAIPENILTKPGKLTVEEFERIKTHPDMGARILEPVQFHPSVIEIVRHHHERWDGSGYPDKLSAEGIPLGGRILAVADVYDAVTSDRSYRPGWTHERAVEYLQENAGSHFDPQIVQTFLQVLSENPQMCAVPAEDSVRDPAIPLSPQEALTDDIGRASFEQAAVFEMARAVSATLGLSETMSLIAARAKSVFNAETVAILLKEDLFVPGQTGLKVYKAIGKYEKIFLDARATLGAGVTGGVAQSGVARHGEYVPDDLTFASAGENALPTPGAVRSVLIAPMADGDGRIIGTVSLYHARLELFHQGDLGVLTAVSAQAGQAILKAIEFDRNIESAMVDSMTGLYNARYLEQFIAGEAKRSLAEKRTFSVLLLDLDNFKPVNDLYGHTHGNQVLRELGQVFQSVLRGGDLVTRYAGDEFVVVLPNTGPQEARIVMAKIAHSTCEYNPHPTASDDAVTDFRIGVSIGLASFSEDGFDAKTLIAVADSRMYTDKRQRKSRPLIEAEKPAPRPLASSAAS